MPSRLHCVSHPANKAHLCVASCPIFVSRLALVSLSSRRQLLLGPAVTAKQALPERLARRFIEPRVRFLGLGLWVEPVKDESSEAAAEPPVVVVGSSRR